MVEEVVNTILEAEDKAEEIKKQAKAEAKKIVDEALASSASFRELQMKKYKVDVNQAKSVSSLSADAVYDKIVEKGSFQVAAVEEAANKNMDRAVKEIIRSIIG